MPDETRNASQGAPQNAGQPSGGKDGSTSKSAPRTYTEEEVKVLTERVRRDALAEAGRQSRPIEDENDSVANKLRKEYNLCARLARRQWNETNKRGDHIIRRRDAA